MINRVKDRHRYRSIFYKKRSCSAYVPNKRCNYTSHIIKLPYEISLSGSSRQATLQAINELKSEILSGSKRIAFDFSKTKKITSAGMIAIYSEIYNIFNVYTDIHIKCIGKATEQVCQVLTQIGLYNICNQKNLNRKTTRSDVVHWRVCSGFNIIGQRIDDIVSNEDWQKIPNDSDIYGGCIEATKNSLRHAYPSTRSGIPVAHDKTGWWCFSQIKDKSIVVVVCDLGVSIPKTLPLNFPDIFNVVKKFGKNTDADIILGALKRPRSSSGESFRGNGLPKIAKAASVGGGCLVIHSRNGEVSIVGTSSNTVNHKQAFHGTIISWTLPLGDAV